MTMQAGAHGDAADYRTFRCPVCHEVIDTLMRTCSYCGSAVDPAAAAAAADTQALVQRACGAASSAVITARAMPVLFLLTFVPVIGGMALAGTIATLALVPAEVLRWHWRFAQLSSPDPDLGRARIALRVAIYIWAAVLAAFVLWFSLRILPTLLTLRAH